MNQTTNPGFAPDTPCAFCGDPAMHAWQLESTGARMSFAICGDCLKLNQELNAPLYVGFGPSGMPDQLPVMFGSPEAIMIFHDRDELMSDAIEIMLGGPDEDELPDEESDPNVN